MQPDVKLSETQRAALKLLLGGPIPNLNGGPGWGYRGRRGWDKTGPYGDRVMIGTQTGESLLRRGFADRGGPIGSRHIEITEAGRAALKACAVSSLPLPADLIKEAAGHD